MAADGLSLIFISHKLREVLRSADRISYCAPARSSRNAILATPRWMTWQS
jgi:ABC-type uncharacterized transport system ATPase subunit